MKGLPILFGEDKRRGGRRQASEMRPLKHRHPRLDPGSSFSPLLSGTPIKSGESRASTEGDEKGKARLFLSARIPAQPPPPMFDMGGLADDAFGEDDFVDRPADRRHLLCIQPVAAIVAA